MSRLTASREDYLRVIDELTLGGEPACVTEIAGRMSVTKASASLAVSELERLGLAVRCGNRRVLPTGEGRALACGIRERDEVLRRFFSEILGLGPDVSRREARRWGHALSGESVQAMRCRLEERKAS